MEHRLLQQHKYCVWLVLGNYPLGTEVTVPGVSWASFFPGVLLLSRTVKVGRMPQENLA